MESLAPSGGEALATAGAPGSNHAAAADGGHAGAETMPALAHELAGLIGPLHGFTPVLYGTDQASVY